MFKNYSYSALLLAFQCDDEIESTLRFNDFKVNITPQSSFFVSDTIWFNGVISSKVYDLAINDSIFHDIPQGDVLSIMRFIEPTQNSNCRNAIDKFQLINEVGEISFIPICENAQITVHSEISVDGLSYVYKIGLKVLVTGDFVISWQDSKIENENRNEYIIDNYAMEYHQNQIGFDKCGSVPWRFLNESEKEYYFSVE